MASDGPRHRPFAASYLLPIDEGQALLSKRKDTEHRDGEYSLVAGDIEEGESATEAVVREGKGRSRYRGQPIESRAGSRQSPKRGRTRVPRLLRDRTLGRRGHESGTGKCADLGWFDPSALPENTVPDVEQAIANRSDGVFDEFGWSGVASSVGPTPHLSIGRALCRRQLFGRAVRSMDGRMAVRP